MQFYVIQDKVPLATFFMTHRRVDMSSPWTTRLSACIVPLMLTSTPLLAASADSTQKPQLIVSEAGEIMAPQIQSSEGGNFLQQNKSKPGVVTLADGLQYKIIEKGHGKKPTLNDTVTVDYEGKLVDGTEFDSSYKRGQPATFPVNGVIPGWTEALQLMPVGSTWELYIPAELAYGEQGAPPQIGPNQTLIFKVKLISIEKAA